MIGLVSRILSSYHSIHNLILISIHTLVIYYCRPWMAPCKWLHFPSFRSAPAKKRKQKRIIQQYLFNASNLFKYYLREYVIRIQRDRHGPRIILTRGSTRDAQAEKLVPEHTLACFNFLITFPFFSSTSRLSSKGHIWTLLRHITTLNHCLIPYILPGWPQHNTIHLASTAELKFPTRPIRFLIHPYPQTAKPPMLLY